MGWVHDGEDRDRLAEFVVQPAQSVDDESEVGDGGAAVESVSARRFSLPQYSAMPMSPWKRL